MQFRDQQILWALFAPHLCLQTKNNFWDGFQPQENKLTAQINVISLQLLNCNLSDDKEDLFTPGSGKDF